LKTAFHTGPVSLSTATFSLFLCHKDTKALSSTKKRFLKYHITVDGVFCRVEIITHSYYNNEGGNLDKKTEQWIKQSDYDIDTASYMFQGGRYFYSVFMCHLAVEKALKGLYYEKLQEVPPKTHNLIFLLNQIGIKPPEEQGKFIIKLNSASIVTRYPEDLEKIQKQYTEVVTKEILSKCKEVLIWIKNQF
jgi:HEPN domain-containing protein